jgi:protease II
MVRRLVSALPALLVACAPAASPTAPTNVATENTNQHRTGTGPTVITGTATPMVVAEENRNQLRVDAQGRKVPSGGYAGHGLESVTPEILERFPVKPLEAKVSRALSLLQDVRSPGSLHMANDGATMTFTWAVTGSPQAWRLERAGTAPRQLTGGEDRTSVVAETPDGALLVVSRDRRGEENPGLYTQPKSGGALVPVFHEAGIQARFEGFTPDGKALYYSANDKKKDSYAVYRFDLASRTRETVFDEDGLWSFADVREDGAVLLVKSTGSLSREIYLFDPKTKAKTALLGVGEKEEYNVAFAPTKGTLFVHTNAKSDKRRVYTWKDGVYTPVTPEVLGDLDGFVLDHAKKRLLVMENAQGPGRVHAFDAATLKAVALPKLPEGDSYAWGHPSRDGRFAPLAVDDGQHPLRLFVVDFQEKKVAEWMTPSMPELDPARFVRATVETYPAADGTAIPAFVRVPPACANAACPVIVQFHGGPEGQARPGFSPGAQAFMEAGFVLVEPNVRGSDGYGKAWLSADDGPKRLNVIGDIRDAGLWARKRFAKGGVEPKVGVYGGSYGGYSTLMAMTMFAGTYDVGVDVVGISNLVTFLENTAPYRRALRISEYGDPEKDRAALVELSPTTHIEKAKAPLLVLQGATDPRVPVGEAVQIHEAFASRGIPSELMIFPDEGHGAQKKENRVKMLGHALAFFQKHLK